MFQHLSRGDLVRSPTELAQSRSELFKGIRGRLVLSLRYLFATEVHAYAFSIAANVYLSFFPFTLLLLTVCRRWLHWEGAYRVILELLRIHLPAGADSIIRNLPARTRASQASTHLRGYARFHQFGGLSALGGRAESCVGYSAEPQFPEEPGYVLLSGCGDGSYGVSFDSPLHRRAMGAHLHPRMDPVPSGSGSGLSWCYGNDLGPARRLDLLRDLFLPAERSGSGQPDSSRGHDRGRFDGTG